jgi:hypothetical protein
VVPVDGDAIEFDLFDYGSDFWVTVGRTPDAAVSISSRGVPLAGLGLVRLGPYPLLVPRV